MMVFDVIVDSSAGRRLDPLGCCNKLALIKIFSQNKQSCKQMQSLSFLAFFFTDLLFLRKMALHWLIVLF